MGYGQRKRVRVTFTRSEATHAALVEAFAGVGDIGPRQAEELNVWCSYDDAGEVHVWSATYAAPAGRAGNSRHLFPEEREEVKVLLRAAAPVVGLVACCGEKLGERAPAKDLYRSPLFRLAKGYVERRCDAWAVLSAAHGLVLPDAELAPYDVTLSRMTADERAAWAKRTRAELKRRWPLARFVVLAGESYRAAVEGLDYVAPLQGLGIGEQLGALSADARGVA